MVGYGVGFRFFGFECRHLRGATTSVENDLPPLLPHSNPTTEKSVWGLVFRVLIDHKASLHVPLPLRVQRTQ